MTTSNDYIVKFSKGNTYAFSQSSEKHDAFLSVNSTSKPATMSVRTKKEGSDFNNKYLFHKYLTKDFAKVEFNTDGEISGRCIIYYQDGFSRSVNYKAVIEFDKNSSSAYKDFKEKFENLLNTKFETQYYDSGKIRYIGEVLQVEDEENSYQGTGTLYYDNHYNSKKYQGEFEDGEYDGAGEFYNFDSKIKIVANNISNGIPIQQGKLLINYKSREEIIDLDFSELWESLKITDKRKKRQFVSSDHFVACIARVHWGESEQSVEELIFEEKSIDEKSTELWYQLNGLRDEVDNLNQKTEKLVKLNEDNGQFLIGAMLSILLVNILIVYLITN